MTREGRRGTWGALVLATMGTLAGPALPAYAEEAGGTVTVRTSADMENWWNTVDTTIRWCRPEISAGDGFTATLPAQLGNFRPEFTVTGTDGDLVATGTVTEDRFLRVEVSGDAGRDSCVVVDLESEFDDGEEVAGQDVELQYVVDGGRYVNHLQVRAWPGPRRTTPNAWGEFRLPEDQCRTLPDSCITWHFDTAAGPRNATRVRFTPEHGQRIACAFVHVDLARLGPHLEVSDTTPLAAATRCHPGGLTVDLPRLAAGTMARVSAPATVTDAFPEGGVDFGAEATFGTGAEARTVSDLVHANTATGRAESASGQPQSQATEEPATRSQGWWPYALLAALVLVAAAAVALRRRH